MEPLNSIKRKCFVSGIISLGIFGLLYFIDRVPPEGSDLFFFSIAIYFLNLATTFIGLFQFFYFLLTKKLNLDTSVFICIFSLITFIVEFSVFGFKGSPFSEQVLTQSLATFLLLFTIIIIWYKRTLKNSADPSTQLNP